MKKANFVARIAVAALSCGAAVQAYATLINFDVDASGNPLNAPATFANTVALRETYAPLGVHFTGPGDNGGGIVNLTAGFGVFPRSGQNFLAFNNGAAYSNGGFANSPQTILFDTDIVRFSIWGSGGGAAENAVIQAFDASNNLVDSDTVTIPRGAYAELQVSGEGIRRVVLSYSGGCCAVFDDLLVPAPATVALLGLGLAGLGWSRRRK